ncbi:hypothetical protein EW026_g4085 [Hermanssonia centrifuga]|uniref:Uncharacterized protein n=1 Tax=Hermanssonia centrifuga TaxID=98765 RepID=A0A4S4KIL1_9APHY|nr:hypothetical protein EW026_g4085 [Hermanssonia centrifuga]
MHKATKIRINRKVKTVGNGARGVKGTTTSGLQISRQRQEALQKRQEMLKGMPHDTRAAVNAMLVEHGAQPDELTWGDYAMEEDGAEWEDEDEEFKGVDTSHEGGEYGDLVQDTLSRVAASKQHQVAYANLRSRRDRLLAIRRNWAAQMDDLTSAYLKWKHAGATSSPKQPQSPPREPDVQSAGEDCTAPEHVTEDPPSAHVFDVTAIRTHDFPLHRLMESQPMRLSFAAGYSVVRRLTPPSHSV